MPHPSDPHTAGAATVNVQTFNFSFGPISVRIQHQYRTQTRTHTHTHTHLSISEILTISNVYPQIKGSVDISKLDANFSVVIFGISISSISGNLKQGIVLNINLFIVNGNLRFYLKNGKEIWVSANLNQPFGGGVHEDHKIFTI